MSTENLTLTPEELLAITGYKQPTQSGKALQMLDCGAAF